MKTIRHIALLLGLTLGALAAFDGYAQSVPSLINYQGKLTDAGGNPLPNGTYGVAFRIWNKKSAAEPGNTLIWGQEYSVAVQSGVFNVILGAPGGAPVTNAAVNDLSFAFADADRYFGLTVTKGTNGVSVGSATEILPRQQMLSTPFALRAASAQAADVATTVINGIPSGTILPYAGSQAPSGYLLCDGSAVGRTTYPALYASVGSNYGVGDGATTFNLPNFKGRVIVGRDASQTEFDALGKTGGEKAHTLTVAEMPAHTHTINVNNMNDSGPNPPKVAGSDAAGIYNSSIGPINSAGGGEAHNTLPPYGVLNYIIKY